jgi:glycosyltransferase involved in cell wall biosynthesis
VFLEAWSYGLPVVSTLDPDEVIAHKGLGYIATDIEELSLAIRKLLASPEQWRSTSLRARYYYLKNHHAESVMPQLESVLQHAIQKGKKR